MKIQNVYDYKLFVLIFFITSQNRNSQNSNVLSTEDDEDETDWLKLIGKVLSNTFNLKEEKEVYFMINKIACIENLKNSIDVSLFNYKVCKLIFDLRVLEENKEVFHHIYIMIIMSMMILLKMNKMTLNCQAINN